MAREFQELLQKTETVAEITAKLRERPLLVKQYAADEEMKKTWCHDIMRDDIWEFVSLLSCKTLYYMFVRA